jgi:hypothetical protein
MTRTYSECGSKWIFGLFYGGIAFRLCGWHLPISRDLMSSISQNSIHYLGSPDHVLRYIATSLCRAWRIVIPELKGSFILKFATSYRHKSPGYFEPKSEEDFGSSMLKSM